MMNAMPTKLRICSPVVMKPRIFAGGFAAGAGGFGLVLAIRYGLCPLRQPLNVVGQAEVGQDPRDFAASIT